MIKLVKIAVFMLFLFVAVVFVIAVLSPNGFDRTGTDKETVSYYSTADSKKDTAVKDGNGLEAKSSSAAESTNKSLESDRDENVIIKDSGGGLNDGFYCNHCGGTGKLECPTCYGTGVINGSQLCGACFGNGKIDCQYCH